VLTFITIHFAGIDFIPALVESPVLTRREINLALIELARLDPDVGVEMLGVAMKKGCRAGLRETSFEPLINHSASLFGFKLALERECHAKMAAGLLAQQVAGALRLFAHQGIADKVQT
jgi:hypothetical protein